MYLVVVSYIVNHNYNDDKNKQRGKVAQIQVQQALFP